MKRVDINKFKNTKENRRARRFVTIPHFLVLVDKYFEGGEKDKALKDKLERELVRFISVPGFWKYVCKDGNTTEEVVVESVVEPVVEPVDEKVEEVVEEVVEETPVEEVVEEVVEETPIEEVVEEESNEIETVNE